MKKFLLLSVTVFTALSMSAASRGIEPLNKGQFAFDKGTIGHAVTAQKMEGARAAIKNGVAKRVAYKAPAQADLYGYYVADFEDDGDGRTPYTASYAVQISEYIYVDDETGESEILVKLNGLINGLADLLGFYDEDGTIYIPEQQGFVHPQYGECYTVGFASVTEDGSFVPTEEYEIVLQVEEDENGYYLEFAEGYAGMGLFLANQELAGEYAGQIVSYEVGTIFNQANYMVVDEYVLASSDATDWEEAEPYPLFIEWIDDSNLFIHNFLHSNVEVNFDEEGYGKIAHNQKLYYSQRDDLWFYPCAWDITDDGHINYNPERDLNCFWSTSGYLLIADPYAMEWEYYVLGMDKGYYYPLKTSTRCVPMEEYLAGDEEGISDILNPYTSKKSFNLAGQLAKRNAQGIVVENGKKIIR